MFAQEFLTFFFKKKKKGHWHGSIEPIAQFKRALSSIAHFQWHTLDEYGTTKQVKSLFFFFFTFFKQNSVRIVLNHVLNIAMKLQNNRNTIIITVKKM